MRSLFINMEVMLRVEDAGFAAYMRHYVERELRRCQEITPEAYVKTGWLQRARQFVGYTALAFLDPRISRGLNFGIE
jgi:cardiolipin synthase A/B